MEQEKQPKLKHKMYCSKSDMRCAVYHTDGICPDVRDCEACKSENQRKPKRHWIMRDELEDMVRQFAHHGQKNGLPAYWTGGLSALERAFTALGWKDPHPCPENKCEIQRCKQWADCGMNTPEG